MLVGRAQELAGIQADLEAALEGEGRLHVVGGEPGIGKTRLAEEARRLASALGMATAWGRPTDEEGSPPYWVFRQIVRSLAAAHPEVVTAMGPAGDDLRRVTPELSPGSGPWRLTVAPHSAEERFRLFETVSAYLAAVASPTGLFVALDDLQWADPSSLLLLVHLARGVSPTRMAVLVTYRDTEVVGRRDLRQALAALAQEPTVRRYRLVGLSEAEVGEQLAAMTGRPPTSGVVTEVRRRTSGNPFFVTELGRVLGRNGAAREVISELPEAVRDAVRGRLSALSNDSRELVEVASVLNAELDPSTLAAVTGRATVEVLCHLDEAVGAGIVAESRESAGYQFVHDLIRDVARREVPTPRRRSIHLRGAEHVERRADADLRLAEVAHHRLEALPLGDPGRAVDAARRAAESAMTQLAWEEAARLYALAVGAATEARLPPTQRCRLLLALAAAHLRANDLRAAEQSRSEAARVARAMGDVESLAQAALVLEEITSLDSARRTKALSVEALAQLPAGDSGLRARLLAQLAVAGSVADDVDEVARVSAEALAMGERLGDFGALRSGLRARQMACSGPEWVEERLMLAERAIDLGRSGPDPESLLWGRLWRFDALVQFGAMDDAERELDRAAEVAEELRRPLARWHVLRNRAAIAAARGRFSDAANLGQAAADLTARWGDAHLISELLWFISVLTGGDSPPFSGPPSSGPPRAEDATVALGLVELGRYEEARAIHRRLPSLDAAARFMVLPTLAGYAALAAAFDDRDMAASAYERLLPFAHLHVCGGAGIITVTGSAHLPLGEAAAVLGNLDVSVRHLRSAIDANERAGLRPFVAFAEYALSTVLMRRGRHGDADEAAALAAIALDEAERLGMAPLSARARQLAATIRSGGRPSALSRREREIAVLVRRGLTNRQIAAAAHVSERTAENHVQHILVKLGLDNRTQIASWAASHDLDHSR